MKNTIKKTLIVSMLVMAIAATSVCGASAAYNWRDVGNYFENNAEDYADQVEDLVETIGQGYEDNAENYPDSAKENPETAPADYMKTVNKLANSFLSGMKSLTKGYIGTFRF